MVCFFRERKRPNRPREKKKKERKKTDDAGFMVIKMLDFFEILSSLPLFLLHFFPICKSLFSANFPLFFYMIFLFFLRSKSSLVSLFFLLSSLYIKSPPLCFLFSSSFFTSSLQPPFFCYFSLLFIAMQG